MKDMCDISVGFHALPFVKLRAIEPEDLDVLYQIENDRSLWKVGVTNVPYSRYTLHDYIANSSSDIYIDRQVRLIIENDKDEFVGIVDLVNFSPEHRRAEVGIVILDNHRRQGYATSALSQIVNYSRQVIHLHQLYAIINETYSASCLLFEKAGFTDKVLLKNWLYDGKYYKNAVMLQKIL